MVDRIFSERVRGVGERLFNNPLTRVNENGVRYRTTRMSLPSWVTRDTMTEGVDGVSSSIDISVERISEARPLSILRDSPLFPNVSKEFRTPNLIEEFRQRSPSDGVEIVDWMHQSAAEAAVLSGWEAEYNQNSQVTTTSGDPTAPHDLIGVGDFNFDPTPGRNVASRGSATFRTPNQNVEIANNSSKTVFNEDNVGWGGVDADNSYQWNGKVAQFKELGETPIENPVRFPNFGKYTIPNVFNQSPPDSSSQAKVSFSISSDAKQDMDVAFRSPNDYSRPVASGTVTVPEGTSNVEFNISSTPEVPPLLTSVQPSESNDVQSIESYTVEAQ